MALAMLRRQRQRGADFTMKEVMDAVHAAFLASKGCDPYDGGPLDASLLVGSEPCLPSGRRHDDERLRRQPALVIAGDVLACLYDVVSRQTAQAKGELAADDYIAHCRAVAAKAAGGQA